jgi:hypothetical protein
LKPNLIGLIKANVNSQMLRLDSEVVPLGARSLETAERGGLELDHRALQAATESRDREEIALPCGLALLSRALQDASSGLITEWHARDGVSGYICHGTDHFERSLRSRAIPVY